jgi:hypothetical protein
MTDIFKAIKVDWALAKSTNNKKAFKTEGKSILYENRMHAINWLRAKNTKTCINHSFYNKEYNTFVQNRKQKY